jgi:hypothetical protein
VASVRELKREALLAHLSLHPDPQRMMNYVEEKLARVAKRGGLAQGALSEAFHGVTVNGTQTISGF